MGLKDFGELNTERFLREAFDPHCQKKLIRAARVRRNVYLVLFLLGFFCIFFAGFMSFFLLSTLSLFLALLSLVVMSKYETQLFFLKGIAGKEPSAEASAHQSNTPASS
jgi:hypothetical protein